MEEGSMKFWIRFSMKGGYGRGSSGSGSGGRGGTDEEVLD
jgi:hypothetical protein